MSRKNKLKKAVKDGRSRTIKGSRPNLNTQERIKPDSSVRNIHRKRISINLFDSNKIIACFTVLGVLVAVAALLFSRKSTLEDQRARLAPIRAELDGEMVLGREIRVNVAVENYGKQPAINVNSVASGGITLPFSKEEAIQQAINGPAPPVVNVCQDLLPQKGYPTIYPSTVQHGRVNIQKSIVADSEILSGMRIFFIHGCVAYETMNEIHHSEYCFFLSPPAVNNGLWVFRSCRGGHRSD
jgi:hypothetical protein